MSIDARLTSLPSRRDPQAVVATLALDPVRCDGRGLCHEAAPGLIELDEWGFPLLPGGTLRAPIERGDLRAARAAVDACPVLALHLER